MNLGNDVGNQQKSSDERLQVSLRTSLGLVAVVCIALALFQFFPGSVMDRLDRVAPGMTKAQVVKQVGRPSYAESRQNGTTDWMYRNGFHDPAVITFDRDGEVLEVFP